MYSHQTSTGSNQSNIWIVFGKKIPKNQCQYISQTICIYFIIIIAAVNLSLERQPQIWLSLLSFSFASLPPCPKIKTPREIAPRQFAQKVINTDTGSNIIGESEEHV
jgi:hypothetical protein